jgi:hypothetical protein
VDGIIPALLSLLVSAIAPYLQARTPVPEPPPLVAPCDPGFGFPAARASCPDPDPLIGRVTAYDGGSVTVQPIRVWVTGPEGQAYAEAHDLDYPFPNDYYQRDVGDPLTVRVTPETICTGSIEVDFPGGLDDHLVGCPAFGTALERHRWVTSALWFDRGRLVQLSELYRP